MLRNCDFVLFATLFAISTTKRIEVCERLGHFSEGKPVNMTYALTSGIGKKLAMQALRKFTRFVTLEVSETDSKVRRVPGILLQRIAMLALLLELINKMAREIT